MPAKEHKAKLLQKTLQVNHKYNHKKFNTHTQIGKIDIFIQNDLSIK